MSTRAPRKANGAKPHAIRIIESGAKPASQFQGNPRNWRKHPEAQRAAVAGSLAELGWIAPVIENRRTGHLVDGHERVWQALQNGDEQVPYVVVDLSENEEHLALTIFDPIGAMAETDREVLSSLMDDVRADDARLQEMIANLAAEEGIIGLDDGDAADAPEAQTDRAEELQVEWGTERGQIWTVGPHRIMCGDSTSKEDVATLMGGKMADLCLTDPPYGIGVNYGASNDDSKDAVAASAGLWLPIARVYAAIVVFTPGVTRQWLYPEPDWVLCWFYGGGQHRSSWGFNCWQPILSYGKDPYLRTGRGCRPDAVNLNTPANASDIGHPCPKPIPLWTWLIERTSADRGDVIFDPFLGSGTTAVAAQQLGRICYGMEIEPKYVAVSLQRLADMGLTPELVTATTEAA